MGDIVAHQADIRFMSMAAQKYIEEAKVRFNLIVDIVST